MTAIIRLTDQTVYQQMAMMWFLLQTLSVFSLDYLDFQSISSIIEQNTGLCTFNLVRFEIFKYLEWINIISFRGHLESPFQHPRWSYILRKDLMHFLFFHKSSILYLIVFTMWISVSLNLITFLSPAFPNLHNFKICICQSGQFLFLIFIQWKLYF